jgi:dTDP-4-dehydrorhamnose 3,5-epimerase
VQLERLAIPDLVLITPDVHCDERGFFSETFSRRALAEAGLSVPELVQDNHSLSRFPGVVRGLHFQAPPQAQDKLVRVVRGAIWDVAVDIRVGSPSYGAHVGVELSAANWRQLWVPKGFAHGFLTLEPDTEVLYKVSDYYAPDCDRAIAFDDPDLCIAWPVSMPHAVVSARDRKAPTLAECSSPFIYGR